MTTISITHDVHQTEVNTDDSNPNDNERACAARQNDLHSIEIFKNKNHLHQSRLIGVGTVLRSLTSSFSVSFGAMYKTILACRHFQILPAASNLFPVLRNSTDNEFTIILRNINTVPLRAGQSSNISVCAPCECTTRRYFDFLNWGHYSIDFRNFCCY